MTADGVWMFCLYACVTETFSFHLPIYSYWVLQWSDAAGVLLHASSDCKVSHCFAVLSLCTNLLGVPLAEYSVLSFLATNSTEVQEICKSGMLKKWAATADCFTVPALDRRM